VYHINIKSNIVDNASIERDIVADNSGQVLEKTAELCCQAFQWSACVFIRKGARTFSVHELTESNIDLFIVED